MRPGRATSAPAFNLGDSFADVPGGTADWTFTGGTIYSDQIGRHRCHRINKADTTTFITVVSAESSVANEPVTVSWTVAAVAPGAGTPTGTVTVADGEGHTCAVAVSVGHCSVTPATAGSKTIRATYSGNTNFRGSLGNATHAVGLRLRTTSVSCSPSTRRK